MAAWLYGPRLIRCPRPAGGYSDVVLHEHGGKDWAAVVFEYSDPFGRSHGPRACHSDAPCYISHGGTRTKYDKARLSGSAAHG